MQGTKRTTPLGDGCRPQIHPKTVISWVEFASKERLRGLCMTTIFASGRPRVPSYGYMENVRFLLVFRHFLPLIDSLPHTSGLGEERTLVRATISFVLHIMLMLVIVLRSLKVFRACARLV